MKRPKEMTLDDLAAQWWADQDRKVPEKGTEAWTRMIERFDLEMLGPGPKTGKRPRTSGSGLRVRKPVARSLQPVASGKDSD